MAAKALRINSMFAREVSVFAGTAKLHVDIGAGHFVEIIHLYKDHPPTDPNG
jgi:hypothetical protein